MDTSFECKGEEVELPLPCRTWLIRDECVWTLRSGSD